MSCLLLRQLNNGNTEKDSKTLLISYKNALQNILLLSPFSFLCFSKHVKKRIWVNFLSDLAKGRGGFNLILVITSLIVKRHAYRNTAMFACNDFK